jgi:hypothetical protein
VQWIEIGGRLMLMNEISASSRWYRRGGLSKLRVDEVMLCRRVCSRGSAGLGSGSAETDVS